MANKILTHEIWSAQYYGPSMRYWFIMQENCWQTPNTLKLMPVKCFVNNTYLAFRGT